MISGLGEVMSIASHLGIWSSVCASSGVEAFSFRALLRRVLTYAGSRMWWKLL